MVKSAQWLIWLMRYLFYVLFTLYCILQLLKPFEIFFEGSLWLLLSKPDKLAEGFCIPPFLSKCGPFDLQQTARFTNAFHQRRLGFVKKKKYIYNESTGRREVRGGNLKIFARFPCCIFISVSFFLGGENIYMMTYLHLENVLLIVTVFTTKKSYFLCLILRWTPCTCAV